MYHNFCANGPVGVFDSGAGGLSILQEIQRQLPGVDLLYVADSAYAPYGLLSDSEIWERCSEVCQFLINQGCKAIVVACNTATAICIDRLRLQYILPIVGVEPAIKPACMISHSSVIGVLATTATLRSARLTRLAENYGGLNSFVFVSCPGFVQLIEAGKTQGAEVRALATPMLKSLMAQNVDTLVLGCTHFPFLRPTFESITEGKIRYLDSAAAIARQLAVHLAEHPCCDEPDSVVVQFFSSRANEHNRQVLQQLWGEEILLKPLPSTPSLFRHRNNPRPGRL